MMKRVDDEFKHQLEGIDFETLENSSQVVFALSPELTFMYFNPVWFRFARENNGEPAISEKFPLHSPIESAISGELKEFYLEKYRHTLFNNKVWNHEYGCSSPDTYRIFLQEVFPLKNKAGLIVINSLKIEKKFSPDRLAVLSPKLSDYVQDTGLINQYSNCRKTQRADTPDVWDWIPAWVGKIPMNVSHSICPVCYDYYWKYGEEGK